MGNSSYLLPGVGFARMESREKCEQIIQQYNGFSLQGAKDALLVKFADGGSKKKSTFKNQDPRAWREVAEVSAHTHFYYEVNFNDMAIILQGIPVAYDATMAQNNVNMGTPIVPYARYNTPQMGGYAMTGSQWGYMMAQPMPTVDEGQVCTTY